MAEDSQKLKKNQRCASILEVALEIMSEKGIEATTMREIAKKEGISETLLYRYFKNKYEIIFEIVETKLRDTNESLKDLFNTTKGMIPDPTETLPIIWKLFNKTIRENHPLLTLFFKEQGYLRKTMFENREIMAQFQKRFGFKPNEKKAPAMGRPHFAPNFQGFSFIENLTGYFKRCKEAGNLREDLEPEHCASMFLRLIWMPTFVPSPLHKRLVLSSDEEELEKLMESQISILIYGLMPRKK